jgi:hypothetical protein
MRTYTIPFVPGQPDWDAIPRAEINVSPWMVPPEGISAFAQLCYNPNALLVRLEAVERNPRACLEGPLDMVCNDSCLEFFLSPDGKRYFNFEFNPKGTMYLGFGTGRQDSVRQLPADYRRLFSVDPFRDGDRWGINFAIPAAFIKGYVPSFRLEKGMTLTGNFYKCGDETEKPHYLTWNPIECGHPDFHLPAFFGRLLLEDI